MANFQLKFSVSDSVLPLVDAMRDGVSREDFFRKAMELGLGELIEAAVRMNRDYLTHTLTGQTKDYRLGRAVLRVDDPEGATPKAAAEVVERRFATGG